VRPCVVDASFPRLHDGGDSARLLDLRGDGLEVVLLLLQHGIGPPVHVLEGQGWIEGPNVEDVQLALCTPGDGNRRRECLLREGRAIERDENVADH
jgi:hypothetical protein